MNDHPDADGDDQSAESTENSTPPSAHLPLAPYVNEDGMVISPKRPSRPFSKMLAIAMYAADLIKRKRTPDDSVH
jgi:hypothetical protein